MVKFLFSNKFGIIIMRLTLVYLAFYLKYTKMSLYFKKMKKTLKKN